MGASAKRKKEKQKDFQVGFTESQLYRSGRLSFAETQAQGRQGQGEAGELYRHQFPIKRYAGTLRQGIVGSINDELLC